MLGNLLQSIFLALSFAFDAVAAIFAALGFPWLAAVCLMVLVSVVLRLFTARFIGTRIRADLDHYKEKREEKATDKAIDAKIRAWKESRDRERSHS